MICSSCHVFMYMPRSGSKKDTAKSETNSKDCSKTAMSRTKLNMKTKQVLDRKKEHSKS